MGAVQSTHGVVTAAAVLVAASGVIVIMAHAQKATRINNTSQQEQSDRRSPSLSGEGDPQWIPACSRLHGAPELSELGKFAVGVRSMVIRNPSQTDVIAIARLKKGQPMPDPLPTCDRRLVVEVWYPATGTAQSGPTHRINYPSLTGRSSDPERRPIQFFDVPGIATRNADPVETDLKAPLIVLAHGYPGNRYLMTNLGEHLASKGYCVVAADLQDSVYDDMGAFGSTLLHRGLDIRFLIDEFTRFSEGKGDLQGRFLHGSCLDVTRIGLIGFSMGGYGVLSAAGAGLSPEIPGKTLPGDSHPMSYLAPRCEENPLFEAQKWEPRIKAVVALAPWGMNHDMWRPSGLSEIKAPTMLICGSLDDTSGYLNGVRKIFDYTMGCDRMLVTFENLNHGVAQNPPPPEVKNIDDYWHYADPVWDVRRVNNVNQHFVTAFLGFHVHGEASFGEYLDWPEEVGHKLKRTKGSQTVVDDEGRPTLVTESQQPRQRKGFATYSTAGIIVEVAKKGQNPSRVVVEGDKDEHLAPADAVRVKNL